MPSPIRPRHHVRVLLSSTALQPFLSVRKAAALAIAQLGVAAFFVSGVARSQLGEAAGWFVLAATVLGAFVRAIDIESWALLIPGGFVSRVREPSARAPCVSRPRWRSSNACSWRRSPASSSDTTWPACRPRRSRGGASRVTCAPEDLATLLAVGCHRAAVAPGAPRPRHRSRHAGARHLDRRRHPPTHHRLGRRHAARRRCRALTILASIRRRCRVTGWPVADTVIFCLLGFALALPVVGGGEALARAAHELPPPRVQALRRTGLLTVLFALLVTTAGTFLVILLVPAQEQALWINAPLAGLAQHLAAPAWARDFVALALVVGAVLLLLPAAHAALGDAEQMLYQSAARRHAARGSRAPSPPVRHPGARRRRHRRRHDLRDCSPVAGAWPGWRAPTRWHRA